MLKEIWARPYSSMYQPPPCSSVKRPGARSTLPFSSRTNLLFASRFSLPVSRSSAAILLASFFSRVLRLRFQAIRNSRVPIAVAPLRALNFASPKSGAKSGVLQFLGQRLVLALADVGKAHAFGTGRRLAVQVDRDAQLLADPPAQPPGQLDAVLHGGTLHRHEGADVGGAHARVLALVLGHVDQLGRLADQPEGGLDDGVRRPGEGDHRAVGGRAGIDVQQHRPLGLRNHRASWRR